MDTNKEETEKKTKKDKEQEENIEKVAVAENDTNVFKENSNTEKKQSEVIMPEDNTKEEKPKKQVKKSTAKKVSTNTKTKKRATKKTTEDKKELENEADKINEITTEEALKEDILENENSKKQAKKIKTNNEILEENIAKLRGKKTKAESENLDKMAKDKKEGITKEENLDEAKVEKEENLDNAKLEKKSKKVNTSVIENGDSKEDIIINEPEENEESQKRKEKLEKEEKLLEKKKKRKNTIITISIISALIIIIIVVSIIIANLNSTKTESHNFFQWYSGQKVEYKGELTFTRKEGLTELKATDKKVTLDSTPVYYAEKENKVIFPEDMAIVFPNNNGMMYRINHFSNIIEESNDVYLETNLAVETNKTKLDQAFLYDGQDLYFFLERCNITVNGTTYEVSPLSYAIVRYKQRVEIYNYEKDEYQVIDIQDGQEAKVITDTYTINMSFDSLQTKEKEQLLIRGLSYLTPYGENKN